MPGPIQGDFLTLLLEKRFYNERGGEKFLIGEGALRSRMESFRSGWSGIEVWKLLNDRIIQREKGGCYGKEIYKNTEDWFCLHDFDGNPIGL